MQTVFPLLADSEVDAIEWSFDAVYQPDNMPSWFQELLSTFGAAGRLIGHGVFFSLLSGRWTTEQSNWLSLLKKMARDYSFAHVTEHFGFMTGLDFHRGAPLPVPLTARTLRIGQDRLKRIADAAHCPVGIENLAFAFSLDDVKQQGAFLAELVEPVNGFLILDLHNVYCQACNFGQPIEEIIDLYPLERVREIHISGGSFEPLTSDPETLIRRDTHDDGVPQPVFDMLELVIQRCPSLQFVTMEQISASLSSENSKQQFRDDFKKMKSIIRQAKRSSLQSCAFDPPTLAIHAAPITDEHRFFEQLALSNILESSQSLNEVRQKINQSTLPDSEWQPEKWNDSMLETAMMIARKWK